MSPTATIQCISQEAFRVKNPERGLWSSYRRGSCSWPSLSSPVRSIRREGRALLVTITPSAPWRQPWQKHRGTGGSVHPAPSACSPAEGPAALVTPSFLLGGPGGSVIFLWDCAPPCPFSCWRIHLHSHSPQERAECPSTNQFHPAARESIPQRL